ncbi:hypothetical protein D3C78_736010 [compost metagenome]
MRQDDGSSPIEGQGVDINITAIERNLRLYGLPAFLLLLGLAGVALIDPSAPPASQIEQVIAPIKRIVFLGAAALAAVSAVWCLWRAGLEYRWSRGALDGGCHNCSGPMRHFDGRYGPYSKCLMCESKRKGWH